MPEDEALIRDMQIEFAKKNGEILGLQWSKVHIDGNHAAFAELNYIHPFREGNGRSTREFMRLLFDYNKYRVAWDAVDTERLLMAMEASVFDTSELKSVLTLCISPK